MNLVHCVVGTYFIQSLSMNLILYSKDNKWYATLLIVKPFVTTIFQRRFLSLLLLHRLSLICLHPPTFSSLSLSLETQSLFNQNFQNKLKLCFEAANSTYGGTVLDYLKVLPFPHHSAVVERDRDPTSQMQHHLCASITREY